MSYATSVSSEEDYAPQLKAIDRNLPDIVQGGFGEWNTIFDDIIDEDARDRFGLTGHYKGRNGRHRRAGIDVDRYKLDNNPHVNVNASCDIDSVLGVVKGHFPIAENATFMYHMMPDVKKTFSTNVHLPPIEITHEREQILVPLHGIPNCRFGEIGRLTVQMFLPGLYDVEKQNTKQCPNYVGKPHMQQLFDLAMQPAAQTILPLRLHRQWPPGFDEEAFRAAPHRRLAAQQDAPRYQHTGREVHGEYFNLWLDEVRRHVADNEELAFARGFILFVEGKGLKNINLSQHFPPDAPLADEETGELFDPENARTVAINEVMKGLDTTQMLQDEWVIDIATTFDAHVEQDDGSMAPLSLFLDSDLHPEIIHSFSGAPLADCARWAGRRCGGYAKDEVAHVERLAGFRMTFDPNEDWMIYYLNVYTSEKSLSYHVDGKKKAKRTSPHLVLLDWLRESEAHFRPLADGFFHSSATHPVAVRIESRVPLHLYPFVHLLPDLDTCKPWFLAIRNSAFWGFKWRRLQACWNVLERACASEDIRRNFTLDKLPEFGSLLIILIYMANALVNRPDDGGKAGEVHDSGCVHVRRPHGISPSIPLGYYALHSLHLPGPNEKTLPRISSLRTISRATLVYLFGTKSEERTELFIVNLVRGTKKRTRGSDDGDPWGAVEPAARRDAQPSRSNKQQRVTASVQEPILDVFALALPEENRRVRYPSEELDHEGRDEGDSLSQRISTIVYTYPVQIFRKAPNRKGLGVSWLVDEEFEDGEANFDTFADPSAPRRLFTSYTDHGRNRDKWESTVKALFPTTEEKASLGRPQGLAQLQVWEDWETLLAGLTPEAERKAVREARDYVSQNWAWLPYYTKRKLWVTGSPASDRTVSRFGPEKGGPWIVFNSKTR